MSMFPQTQNKLCYVSCSEEKIRSGQCSCINYTFEDFNVQIRLEISDLNIMVPDIIIYRGEGIISSIYDKPIKWAAIVGNNSDWYILYQLEHMEWSDVLKKGEKLLDKEIIRILVPCTNEAFERYNFT
jgi:hypothetical protein